GRGHGGPTLGLPTGSRRPYFGRAARGSGRSHPTVAPPAHPGRTAATQVPHARTTNGDRPWPGPVAVVDVLLGVAERFAPANLRGAQVGSSAELLPGGAQPLAGLHDPLGHPGLGELAPGARVVGLLVAHLAVDLEHKIGRAS